MNARPLFGPARRTLGDPATTKFLDDMTAEFTALDAQQRIREQNEAIFRRYVENWMRRTDAAVDAVTDALVSQAVRGV